MASQKHVLGGVRPTPSAQNSAEIQELAEFAITEHNSKENSALQLERVVSSRQQVVAGTLYYIDLVASGKEYEAKVWVKPWENFKSLEGFTPVEGATDPPAGPSGGGQAMSVDDPLVKEGAMFAVEKLQSQSNSLVPYTLAGIVSAQEYHKDDAAPRGCFPLEMCVRGGAKSDSSEMEVVVRLSRGATEEVKKVKLVHSEDTGWAYKGATPVQ